MTLSEFTVFVLILWGIREIIIGFWTGHRNRSLRKLIRIERTQQHFAEARNDLMRLALDREIDIRSETFGSLYRINTLVMRFPDAYPELSAVLKHLVLTTPTNSDGLPEESKHWSPSICRVVKETADAMDYIILEYSRVFRFWYWVNKKADPTITPIRLLRRIAQGLEERESRNNPIVSEIRETQRKMHSLCPA